MGHGFFSILKFFESDFLLTCKRDILGENGTQTAVRSIPDNCKRRANHERMFPRTDVRIGSASQEPENTADNDTLASGMGGQQRHGDEAQEPESRHAP